MIGNEEMIVKLTQHEIYVLKGILKAITEGSEIVSEGLIYREPITMLLSDFSAMEVALGKLENFDLTQPAGEEKTTVQ